MEIHMNNGEGNLKIRNERKYKIGIMKMDKFDEKMVKKMETNDKMNININEKE